MAVLLPIGEVDATTRRLIDANQRDFPIVPRPFAEIGARLSLEEGDVIARIAALVASGAVSRVGAVVRPHAAGASTLAALAAPARDIEAVAAKVNAFPGVNHNYEREGAWNLWFVVTGRAPDDVEATLAGVAEATGLEVLNLPLEQAFHIDLGFSLFETPREKPAARPLRGAADPQDKRILAAIEGGLPLLARPFAEVGRGIGMSEDETIARLGAMAERGVVTRFGLIVRHRAFGYNANAMTVWDVADGDVEAVGDVFAREPGVTLCYRRPRRMPHWRYNLFTMIHGRDRSEALAVVGRLAELAGPRARAHDVLFSLRCFKQRGAMFSNPGAAA